MDVGMGKNPISERLFPPFAQGKIFKAAWLVYSMYREYFSTTQRSLV